MESNNPSSPPRVCKYDVFLSFRGTDTRNTFTDHLYHHLVRKGIFVFKDDQSLQKGESISPQLLQAIQDSRVSIVVFSRYYAASSWCLDEMAAVADCHNQLKQTVFPVFYDIDPSHARKQIGVFEDAFFSHTQKRFKHDPSKVERWKRAMTELGNLVGLDVRDNACIPYTGSSVFVHSTLQPSLHHSIASHPWSKIWRICLRHGNCTIHEAHVVFGAKDIAHVNNPFCIFGQKDGGRAVR